MAEVETKDFTTRWNDWQYFSFCLFFSLIYTYDLKQWANKVGKRKLCFVSLHLVKRSTTMLLRDEERERGRTDIYGCFVHTYFFWFKRQQIPILELPFCPAVPFIPIYFGLFYFSSSFSSLLLRHMDLFFNHTQNMFIQEIF
jgi:hypothetical protein